MKLPVRNIVIVCLIALCAMAVTVVFMPWNFNADSAFYPILAREQLASGSLFPPGMCYSTELFVASPSILMIPFMAFMDNWMLARSFGICVLWAIAIFFLVKTFVIRGDAHWKPALLACLLACMPLFGSDLVDKIFLQGAYLIYYVHLTAFLVIAHYLIVNYRRLSPVRGLPRRDLISLVLMLVGMVLAIVLPNLGGIRGILQEVLPFLLAFAVLWFIDGGTLDDLVKNRFHGLVALVWLAGIVIALVGYKVLSSLYWSTSEQMAMSMVSPHEVIDGIAAYFKDLLSLYGQNFEAPLTSLSGIMRTHNYVYAVLMIVVFPVYSLVRIKTFKNVFARYLILFCWLSNLLMFAISVVTGAVGISPRYLIPTYFLNILIAVTCIEQLLEQRTPLEGRAIVVCVIAYVLVATGFFWKRALPLMRADQTHQNIVAFLEENDLEYGYATFFNSYVNTCYANGDVEFVSFAYSIEDEPGDPTFKWRWLTNEKWYDPSYHPGRCFILLRGDERVESKWYDLASQKLTYEDYTVLVFDKNINLY